MNHDLQLIIDRHTIWLDTDGAEGKQANFTNMDLQELNFKNLNLSNSIFRGTNLIRANIENCRFDGSDFTDAKFNYTTCTNSTFIYCNMTNTNFDGATIKNSNFSSTNLTKTNFYNTRTFSLIFNRAVSKGSTFNNSILLNANFKKAVLEDTTFNNTNISKSSFGKTKLHNSNLDLSIGVPIKNTSIEVDDLQDEYISINSHIKLLRRLSKIFYSLGILIIGVVLMVGIFELYSIFSKELQYNSLNFNYISWIVLDIFIILIATFLNLLVKWIIRKDKIDRREINHG